MTPQEKTLQSRITNPAHSETVRNMFGLAQRVANLRATLATDNTLSDAGRRAKEAELAKMLVRNLAELSRPMQRAKAEIAAKRAALQPKPIDRSDVVAELQRRELREFVRSLPLEKRLETVLA